MWRYSIPYVIPNPLTSGAGFAGSSSSSGSGGSVKEKVNTWIHCQLESFLEKWVPPDQTHPALDAVRRLTTSVERLSLSSSDYLDSLKVCLCALQKTFVTQNFV